MQHDTIDTLSIPCNKSGCSTVNGCHEMIFCCNAIKLYIFRFRSKMTRQLSLILDCLSLLRIKLPHCSVPTRKLLHLTERLLPVFCHVLLHNEEVSHPKTIDKKNI